MCIGIPMRVLESRGRFALCAGRGTQRWLDLGLVGEQPVGTCLLAFLDTAREVLDEASAILINDAIDALEAALNGDTDLSSHFTDLNDRTPRLPEHLLGALP